MTENLSLQAYLYPYNNNSGSSVHRPPSLPNTRNKISPDTNTIAIWQHLGPRIQLVSQELAAGGSTPWWKTIWGRKKKIKEGDSIRKGLRNHGCQGPLILWASILKQFTSHLLSLIPLALGIGLMFPLSFFHSSFWQVFPITCSRGGNQFDYTAYFQTQIQGTIWPNLHEWMTSTFWVLLF